MLRRTLGRTGLEVPIVGLGGAGLGQSIDVVRGLVDRALEGGANFLHVYAGQEANIGRILEGRRDSCVIAAHVDVYREPERNMGTAAEVMGRVETCLQNLRTDCVELFQFHGVMDAEMVTFIRRPGGPMEALKRAQEEGKIRFIGITGHHAIPLVQAMKTDDFDTVMVPFNIMRRDFGEDPSPGLFPLARRMDIGTIIMKPVANGRISKNLASALSFVLAHDVTLAIPGATSLDELKMDLEIAETFSALSEEERGRYIDEAFLLGEPYCRACGYCRPCPGEMDIPAVLRMERYGIVFGLSEWIRASEGGDIAVYPDRCEGCDVCEEKCPFDLPIREMIANAPQYLPREG